MEWIHFVCDGNDLIFFLKDVHGSHVGGGGGMDCTDSLDLLVIQ